MSSWLSPSLVDSLFQKYLVDSKNLQVSKSSWLSPSLVDCLFQIVRRKTEIQKLESFLCIIATAGGIKQVREAPWNDKCCSNGFLPRGGGVENPVQMVWGSYLVNINHYWDTKFSSYFTIIFHDIHQITIWELNFTIVKISITKEFTHFQRK